MVSSMPHKVEIGSELAPTKPEKMRDECKIDQSVMHGCVFYIHEERNNNTEICALSNPLIATTGFSEQFKESEISQWPGASVVFVV